MVVNNYKQYIIKKQKGETAPMSVSPFRNLKALVTQLNVAVFIGTDHLFKRLTRTTF